MKMPHNETGIFWNSCWHTDNKRNAAFITMQCWTLLNLTLAERILCYRWQRPILKHLAVGVISVKRSERLPEPRFDCRWSGLWHCIETRWQQFGFQCSWLEIGWHGCEKLGPNPKTAAWCQQVGQVKSILMCERLCAWLTNHDALCGRQSSKKLQPTKLGLSSTMTLVKQSWTKLQGKLRHICTSLWTWHMNCLGNASTPTQTLSSQRTVHVQLAS